MVIHPTAIVSSKAELPQDIEIGPYSVIGKNVQIGSGTTIAAHCVIDGYTEIGSDCTLFPHASIGLEPQDLSYNNEPTKTIIGDRNVFREFCTVHRGTQKGRGETVIKNDCYFMNYVHVGHDCLIGDKVIIANGSSLGGHVTVHKGANISALFLAHQFVDIGEYVMISGFSGTRKSIPPYVMVDGRVSRIMKTNLVGLKRAGFSDEEITEISRAYRLIKKLPLVEALQEISLKINSSKHLKVIHDFYTNSKRGVALFAVPGKS